MAHVIGMTLEVDVGGLHLTGHRREEHFVSQVHAAVMAIRNSFGSQHATPGDVRVSVVAKDEADPGGSSDMTHVSPDTTAPDPMNHSVDHPHAGVRPDDVLAAGPETLDPASATQAQLARDAAGNEVPDTAVNSPHNTQTVNVPSDQQQSADV